MKVRIEPVSRGSVAFHRLMTYKAYYWNPKATRPRFSAAMNDPNVRQYFADWGRAGDTGLIAKGPDGRGLGMAWARLYPEDRPAFGFVAPDVPEISVAVAERMRGETVGTQLLESLLNELRAAGFERASLAVEDGNPAVRLYERMGFVTARHHDGARVMTKDLSLVGPAAAEIE